MSYVVPITYIAHYEGIFFLFYNFVVFRFGRLVDVTLRFTSYDSYEYYDHRKIRQTTSRRVILNKHSNFMRSVPIRFQCLFYDKISLHVLGTSATNGFA